jgi:MFS transporter, Spinster family, sphingosine-1-phosphate transporter
MAHDVFISHSAKDKKTADAVCAMLESEGIRCWIAPRDIVPGMEWGRCIIEAIKKSRIMVLVFTANANTSPQIRREVERAVNHDVAILPFRVENVIPDESLEYFIGNVHWLDALTPPIEAHIRSLTGTIRVLLDRIEPRDFDKGVIDKGVIVGSAPSPDPPGSLGSAISLGSAAPAPFPPVSTPPPPAIPRIEPQSARPSAPPPPAVVPQTPTPPPRSAASVLADSVAPAVSDAPSAAFGFRRLDAEELPKPEARAQSVAATPPAADEKAPAHAGSSASNGPLFSAFAEKPPKPARLAHPGRSVFLLLLGLNLVASIDRVLFSTPIRRYYYLFDLSVVEVGRLNLLTHIGYLVAALAAGWLGNRFQRKPLLVGVAAFLSLATLAGSWTGDVHRLFFSQVASWFGMGFFDVLSLAVLSDYYPARERCRVFFLYLAATPAAAIYLAAAPQHLFGGILAAPDPFSEEWSWRGPFVFWAIPGLLLAALFLWLGREPERGASDRMEPALSASPGSLFRNHAFLTATVAAFLVNFTFMAASSTAPVLAHILPHVAEGPPLLASLAGIVLGGLLAQRWLRRDRRAFYLLSAGSIALALPFYLLAFFGPEDWIVLMLTLAQFLLAFQAAPLLAAAANSVAAPGRALALAIFLLLFRSLSSILAGPLVSALIASQGVRTGLGLMSVVLVVACILLFIGARFAPALDDFTPQKQPSGA